MSLGSMTFELATAVPEYSSLLARTHVNRAWGDLRRQRSWSWLFYPGLIQAATQVSAGTVSWTQGSPVLTLDATAAAAVAAVAATGQAITALQVQLSGQAPIFNVVAYTPAGPTLTLSANVTLATASGQGYLLYQTYFPGYVPDQIRWVDVVDPISGYQATRLHVDQRLINAIDPTRTASSQSFWVSDAFVGPTGSFLYEFWPAPSNGQTFAVLIQRAGVDLAYPNGTLPGVLPESIVIERAKYYAYEWAMVNAGRFPSLQKTNWGFLMQNHQKQWLIDLAPIKKQDDEIRLNTIIYQRRQNPYAFGDQFLQAHDPGFFYWGARL